MSQSKVAIIGSGIVGTTLAYLLSQQGHQVTVFEKGREYAYPYTRQWQENTQYFYENPADRLPLDLRGYTSDGIPFSVNDERFMRVGGSASAWEAICIRMMPSDFRTQTLFGYGDDWPIVYDDLEAYYGHAERFIGVSGTDEDNPFAPPRSMPYPLPPFELAHDDVIMQERLSEADIQLHSTPQARTREPYEGRAACQNFGTCRFCPIGARYSPGYHLQQAIATGFCEIKTETSVRRIVPEGSGNTVVYRENNGSTDLEHQADIVIVAAGAIESARLLLLSKSENDPDGLGNQGGWVGAGLSFHHVWKGRMYYDEPLFPFRFGGWTGQSLQFVDAPTRGSHAAVKVEFSSRKAFEPPHTWGTANQPYEAMLPMLGWRQIVLQAEAASSKERYLTLSSEQDRFGDLLPHIYYRLTDFDEATYNFSREIFDRFVSATSPQRSEFPPLDWWDSGSHHMGTCRMGTSVENSVVNSFGQLHTHPGIFVVGGSNFVGTSGAANPTLTMVALAMRTADFIAESL